MKSGIFAIFTRNAKSKFNLICWCV